MTLHPRATLAAPTPPTSADETPPRVASALQVKPKILRRPAQFSSPATPPSTASMPDLYLHTPAPLLHPETSTMPRPWQDDPHFAIALLAIVILVNVALSIGLSPGAPAPSITNTTRAAALEPTETFDASVTPSPEDTLLFHLGEAGARVLEQ